MCIYYFHLDAEADLLQILFRATGSLHIFNSSSPAEKAAQADEAALRRQRQMNGMTPAIMSRERHRQTLTKLLPVSV
jgi:hypothetical protein